MIDYCNCISIVAPVVSGEIILGKVLVKIHHIADIVKIIGLSPDA
jgi:hypothetical protein